MDVSSPPEYAKTIFLMVFSPMFYFSLKIPERIVQQVYPFADLAFADDEMPIYFHIDELLPYREYVWTRDEARQFPEEWDALKESMAAEGFLEDRPVQVYLGKNGVMKVGEGNHRLAIAQELGIEQIPVRFFWQQEVWLEQQLTPYEKREKALEREKQEQRRQQEREKQEREYAETEQRIQEKEEQMTPEELERSREETEDIMKLLGL